MARPKEWILHFQRHRFLPDAGGGTVFVCVTYDGGIFDVIRRLSPGQYPEFEGEEAWFRVIMYPRRRLEILEQVQDKSGAPLVGHQVVAIEQAR